MKIGLIVIPDDSEHFGISWDEFDEQRGYHQKDLRRLYRAARMNLSNKNKYIKEQKGKEAK